MPIFTVNAADALHTLDSFDSILDARSESEYAEDHLPGAVNWPTLNDAQRHEIGALYTQVNPFEARKRGAAIAARNIADHIDRHLRDQARGWKPLTYCWRGGKRSGSLSLILSEIGFRVTLIEGGYKAFRAALLADLPVQAARLKFQVVCGTTGSGKTRLLHALTQAGAQVLDLEALARHRSSVLGALPGESQPSQKAFDTAIWNTLRHCDPDRVVYVESESRKVGNVAIPESLVSAMRVAPCLNLHLPDENRVALLLEDYAHFVQDVTAFCERLDVLKELRGRQVIESWKSRIRAGQLQPVVQELLQHHYDPGYQQSMSRNFENYHLAPTLEPVDHSPEAMRLLALDILRRAG